MTTLLFEFPRQSTLGRVLPKNKIYERAAPSTAVRELFVRQVEQIIWQFKLSPETTNLPARLGTHEIQVFVIKLKGRDLDKDVLRCIDQAIPSPILFELVADNCRQAVAAYKQPSEGGSGKWMLSEYFESSWLPADAPRAALPVSLDLAGLYDQLVSALMPLPARPDETMAMHIERLARVRAKQREVDRVAARLKQEKQFNRKVEINAKLRSLRAELDVLGR